MTFPQEPADHADFSGSQTVTSERGMEDPQPEIDLSPPSGNIPVGAEPVAGLAVPTDRGSGSLPSPVTLVGNPKLQSLPLALPVVADRPPDSTIDGAEVGELIVRAASLRGDEHRYYGEPRQDSFMLYPINGGSVLAVAVADGVGSQELSHVGSAAACRLLGEEIESEAMSMLNPDLAYEHDLSDRCQRLVERVARRLAELAHSRQLLPKALSTTLVGALFGAKQHDVRRVVLFAVGDSPAYLLKADGEFEPVFDADENDDIASSATDALPTQIGKVTVRVADVPGGTVVVLCTDGLGNPLRSPEVKQQLAEWWRTGPPPSLPEFYWQLSFRAQSYGDDRTAVCVWVC